MATDPTKVTNPSQWQKEIEAITVRCTDGTMLVFAKDTEGMKKATKFEIGYLKQNLNRNNEPKQAERLEWDEIIVQMTTAKRPEVVDT